MIKIETYFFINNEFIPMNRFKGQFDDIDYIEGAIELTINNKKIISLKSWDYVDQLWAYFINGIEEIQNMRNFFTYFPDQPVVLSFTLEDNDFVKIGTDYDGEIYLSVPKKEFISTVCSEAEHFFKHMSNIVPQHKNFWNEYLGKIKKIKGHNSTYDC
ncbi:hypothetical protein DENIS_0798 [Desulfonema ishimotonii]|uniref:Uncharacterized protein n=2 Tax=Desulfonema ishimotonii TaxID=45657 RepID=A0A401FSB6_9BACT|nr:hypothetical protein DENIS_0798 [Desulfonema ishimotonii]